MLPILKKHEGSASSPIEAVERKPDEESDYDGLESAMEELCSALESKDYKAAASSFRAAFDMLDNKE
jgi:hypothetical protein